jgi:hypothetical protein
MGGLLSSRHMVKNVEHFLKPAWKRFYELEDRMIMPLFNRVFSELLNVIHYLLRFLDEIYTTCEAIERRKVAISPNPCLVHTAFSPMEQVINDFERIRDYATGIPSEVGVTGKAFLASLKRLSFACERYIGIKCLRLATPSEATPASLFDYAEDLVRATRLIHNEFRWYCATKAVDKEGLIYMLGMPMTEAYYVVYHARDVLLEQIKEQFASPWLKGRFAIFQIFDVATGTYDEIIGISMLNIGDISLRLTTLRPERGEKEWVVNVYPFLKKEAEVPRRILEGMGFKTEPTDVGFRLVVPRGKAVEVVETLCMLPSVPLVDVVGEDEAYRITLSRISFIREKLKRPED